ncbi:hypothetical protein HYH02_009291 [Chlamydomonas schloesseri]|uniref:Uncharacterized protein n=1 Tax=Chlamydomonas schloesseri TaxID=2026947 RepID=A0A835W7A9_9CHLO|nr:hypothetical protein HYH02_009291 [Chlamydomonas schloesseri]|eukprot:KAG2443217.1 hypothetical protein HYH02_009291 [Chlamydomonas schloesseri]
MAKAKSFIAAMEHKKKDQPEARPDLEDPNHVFRHALRAHAANMVDHVNIIAGVGPTQRRLPRKSAARVQYEDISATAAMDEYEIEDSDEEGGGAHEGPAGASRPVVPALRLPTAATAGQDAAAGQAPAHTMWASAREHAAPPPRRAHIAPAGAAAGAPPAADRTPHVTSASAAPAIGAAPTAAAADAGSGADAGGFQLNLPRTEQLLMALKKYTGGSGGQPAAARPATLTDPYSPQPSPGQAPADASRDAFAAPASPRAAAGATGAPPLSPRPLTPPSPGAAIGSGNLRGGLHGATAPPLGYPSMPPPSAAAAAAAAATTNVVSRSLTPRQMQQALAAMATAATDAAAALIPTRSAASFTAAVGGVHRPTLTQLFPEAAATGPAAGGAGSGLVEGSGAARELSATAGDVAALHGATQSFSGPALRRLPQRRGSMVLLPGGGVGAAVAPASQALRPTLARARLARRSETSGDIQNYPFPAAPAEAAAGALVGGGGSGPASPVSPVKPGGPPATGTASAAQRGGGLRAAAEALFRRVSRSPARTNTAGSQEWYYAAADSAAGPQPPLSPSSLRFASTTAGGAATAAAAGGGPGTGTGSPFATAAAGASVYVARTGSSSLPSPVPGIGAGGPAASPAGLFAGLIAAASGGGSAGGSVATNSASSLRARVAPPSPVQVTSQQSGESWFVERTASAMQVGACSSASSSARRLPTPSALSAAPAIGGSSFSSSVAASPNSSTALPRLVPSALQPSPPPITSPLPPPAAAASPPGPAGVAPPPAATAVPAASAAIADSSDAAGCVCAPLQVLQPTPPPPSAARRGRVRASASCYVVPPAGGVAEVNAYAAFTQKPRSVDNEGSHTAAHALPVHKPPPLPLTLAPVKPPAHHHHSAALAAQLQLAACPFSASCEGDRALLLGTVAAAVAAPDTPAAPASSEAFAFQKPPEPAAAAPLGQASGQQECRAQQGAFAAPPPPARSHAMTPLPLDPVIAPATTPDAGATLAATAVAAAPAAMPAAMPAHEEATSCSCAEVLESLSCWAGALNDAVSASDRVLGQQPVQSVQSFGRSAWVARSREEPLGRGAAAAPATTGAAAAPATTGAAAASALLLLQQPVAGLLVTAESQVVLLEMEGGSGAAGASPAAAVGRAAAAAAAPVAAAASTAVGAPGAVAEARNAKSGIMSRMKRALLPGAFATGGSGDGDGGGGGSSK